MPKWRYLGSRTGLSGRLKFGEVVDEKERGNYSFRVGEGGGNAGGWGESGFGVVVVEGRSQS